MSVTRLPAHALHFHLHVLVMSWASVWLTACEAPEELRECRADTDCASTRACLAAVCVEREPGPRSFGVVVVPLASTTTALTEIAEQAFAGPQTVIQALPNVPVAGSLRPKATTTQFAQLRQGELGVLVTLPSLTAGASPLRLTATAKVEAGVATFVLRVPQNRVGALASVLITPRAPHVDTVSPPVRVELVQLAPGLEVTMPGAAELGALEGRARSELDQKALVYSVRVMRGGALVSNRAALAEDGYFRVSYWREPQPQVPDAPAELELSAAGPTSRPRVRMPVPESGSDVGTLRLPAHPSAQRFRVPVVAVNLAGGVTPIVGATVRMETTLSSGSVGARATFVEEAQSGADGIAQMSLIPGSLETSRPYLLQVVSPPGSEGASACPRPFLIGLATASGAGRTTTATIELPPRPVVAGAVTRVDLSPVAEAVVTATRLGPLPDAPDCLAHAATRDVDATTDSKGRFNMRLERGSYRMQVRPANGDESPMWQLEPVLVNADAVQISIPLPPGRVLDARVVNPDGSVCKACEVRLYDRDPDAFGVLRAEAISGVDGTVRVVVPQVVPTR